MKSTLTSLLLSCNKVPPSKADSIADALSTVQLFLKILLLKASALNLIIRNLQLVVKYFKLCQASEILSISDFVMDKSLLAKQ